MARYKVGDKVRVRPDLKDDNTRYYMIDKNGRRGEWYPAVDDMVKMAGCIVTIDSVKARDKFYCIEGDVLNYSWTDEMFIPAKSFTCKSLL